MKQLIQGTYRNGIIALDRLPDGVTEARVAVEFAEVPSPPAPTKRRGIAYYGMCAPADGVFVSDEEIERAKKSFNVKVDEAST